MVPSRVLSKREWTWARGVAGAARGTCSLPATSRPGQWNSHGYEIAKVFGSKFTQISPVWLQLKRRGREMFEVTGLHDVDQGFCPPFPCVCPRACVRVPGIGAAALM